MVSVSFVAMRSWFIILVLLLNVYGAVAQALPDLVPYTDGKLWGYADTNGKVVIEPKWFSADLFSNGKAVVSFKDSGTTKPYFCIINEQGSYIIPPEYKWEGAYNGRHGYGNMNMADGRRAVVDTNGVIERVYPQGVGRFGIVGAPGALGYMDTNGKLLLPYRYSTILACCNMDDIGAIIVRDTGEAMKRHNAYGVMGLDGREILPMQYHDIYYEPESEFGRGFRVSRRTNDGTSEPAKMEYLWIDYETGKQRKLQPGWGAIVTYKKAEGYLLRSDGVLVSRNKKVLLDGRIVQYVLPDTILVSDYAMIGMDTGREVTQYFRTQTLEPYGPADTAYYYVNSSRFLMYDFPCGNGYRAWNEHQSWYNSLPEVMVGRRKVKEFYQDSLLLGVQGYGQPGPHPFMRGVSGPYNMNISEPGKKPGVVEYEHVIVQGRVVNGNSSTLYSGVMHEQGSYTIPLQSNYTIVSYNAEDGLAVGQRYYGKGYSIFDSNGLVVQLPEDKQITGAFYRDGKLITYLVTHEAKVKNPVVYDEHTTEIKRVVMLADSMGNPLSETIGYNIVGEYVPNGKFAGFVVKNDEDLIGIIDLYGKPLFPAIQHRYKYIRGADEYLAVVQDSTNRQRVVYTTGNKEVINVNVHLDLEQASRMGSLRRGIHNRNADIAVPGLYKMSWRTEKDYNYVYIDYKGRIYGEKEFL